MKTHILFIILSAFIYSCNGLNDERPVDPVPEIPAATVNAVKTKFPDAEELVFKPILENRIWEVKLRSAQQRYTSLVDFGKMWDTFKAIPDSMPTVLDKSLGKSKFAGGALSSYSIGTSAYGSKLYRLVYGFQGNNYSLEWSDYNVASQLGSAILDPSLYRITTFDIRDIPLVIKDFISARSQFTFVSAQTWVRLDYSKMYYVQVKIRKSAGRVDDGGLIFDAEGRIRWFGDGFTQAGVPTVSSNLDPVPEKIQQYIANSPELAGFEYQNKIVNELEGVKSYYLKMRYENKSKTEMCEMYFDPDANLLSKRYFLGLQ
jgi:hypothetical protein